MTRTRDEVLKRFRYQIAIFLSVVGPGLITANVDNDSGGIFTYSQAGAKYGYLPLWTLIPITLLLIVTQEMCSRMGAVTGKGLSDLIREEFGLRTTFFMMIALVLDEFHQRDRGVRRHRQLAGAVSHQPLHFGADLRGRGLVPGGARQLPQRREDLPVRVLRFTSPTSSPRFW